MFGVKLIVIDIGDVPNMANYLNSHQVAHSPFALLQPPPLRPVN